MQGKFKFGKKAVANIATFSLLLILFFAVFLLSYNFYNNSKDDRESKSLELEVNYMAAKLRTTLLNTMLNTNTVAIYNDSLTSSTAEFILEGENIIVQEYGPTSLIRANYSMFGMNFCGTYNFTKNINVSFGYNGSCISMSTS